MRSTLLIFVVSCSSSPAPRPVPVAPVAVTPDAAAVAVKHRCTKSVWPWFRNPDDYPDEPAEPDPPPTDDEPHEYGGSTLDVKAAELAAQRPDGGTCDDRHRDELEAAILKVPVPAPAAAAHTAWDHHAALGYRATVREALALTATEERQLARDGFVVPARLGYDNFTTAYDDIHRGELPVFVSVDSILNAIYASHDQLFGKLEKEQLVGRLDATLGAMHCALAAAAADYPPDVARDVDLYLTVARSLLAKDSVPGELGAATGEAAQPLIEMINAAGSVQTIELFGRRRAIDATQFTPRGHYAGDDELERYFRAAMWLSRAEFNLVSRDSRSSQPGYTPDPSETPREAVDALALADLADRSGALANLDAMDRAWTAFAGRREDVTFAQLATLRAAAGITSLTAPDVADRLRVAIGEQFVRTVNVHPMPNVDHLPVIATMLGPRITPDTVALGELVGGRGPELQAAEVGFMLGQDRGLHYVDKQLEPRLRAARTALAKAPPGDDLYSAWLHAIRALGERPRGTLPAFMDSEKFADLRLDTALAAYGQLRHNHVLIAAQIYDQGGCEIPDGFVEPAIETYRALAEYAARGRTVFAALDGHAADPAGGAAYFARLERLMRVLAALSAEELAGHALSADAKRFLSMIVEQREATAFGYNGTFPVATYDGWYLDLYPQIDVAFHDAAFIADYATYDRNGARGIHYLGAKGPRLGVFVVDAGGAPRLMVGPVARAYEFHGPLEHRLDDTAAAAIAGLEPWAAGYTVAARAEPSVGLEFQRPVVEPVATGVGPPVGRRARRSAIPPNVLRVTSEQPRDLTVELLDHHFVKLTTITAHVGKGKTDLKAPATARPVEAFRIREGELTSRIDLNLDGYVNRELETP